MATIKVSKSELSSEINNLITRVSTLKNVKDGLINVLGTIPNCEGINLSDSGLVLASNIRNVVQDVEVAAVNINNYFQAIMRADSGDDNAVAVTEVVFSTNVTSDGSRDGNIIAIWRFLKAKGLSDNAIAGVLGNISAECGFNPAAIESNGEGHGLIQWSFGRKQRLLARAKELGVDWTNLQFQLEFLWDESLDPNSSYGKKLAKVGFYDSKISIEDAAFYFHKYVEVSADSKARIQKNRINKAVQLFNDYKQRVYEGQTGATIYRSNATSLANIEKSYGTGGIKTTAAITTNKGISSLSTTEDKDKKNEKKYDGIEVL